MTTGLVLLAHGSPDPDWRRPAEVVQERVAASVAPMPVVLCYLEHAVPSLDTAIAQLAAQGYRNARVLALFLSPGGNHLKRHIPDLVAEVGSHHPTITLELVPGALGAEPEALDGLVAAAVRRATR